MLTPEPAVRDKGAKPDYLYSLVNEAQIDSRKETLHV